MPDSSATPPKGRGELLKAFLYNVSGRVAAINENWKRLLQSGWEREKLDHLRERIRALAQSSAKLGLVQLNECARSLDKHLSSFASERYRPEKHDIAELDSLFRDLTIIATRAAEARLEADDDLDNDAEAGAEHPPRDVFLLGIDTALLPGIEPELEAGNLRAHPFFSPKELFEAIKQTPPAAIVSDAKFVSRLQLLKSGEAGAPVPVVYVSRSNDLRTRLRALRGGADAYFVTPANSGEVVRRVTDLIEPEEKRRPYRVLIVEDDPSQADFASELLRAAKMVAHVVTEPLKVIDEIASFEPDLVLMDLYMPEANGIELTTIIHERPEFVDIPIVFLSGEQNIDKQLNALSVGGEDFLAKPVRPQHLVTTVRNRIRRSKALHLLSSAPSRRDRVTGLFNRHYLLERLDRALAASAETPPCAVLFVQIDNPDRLLDKVGLGGLDSVLAETGRMILPLTDPKDVVARFGDYSLALLVTRPDAKEIHELANLLRNVVADHLFELEPGAIGVTVSVGIAPLDAHGRDATTLVYRAQSACRAAQTAGGNRTREVASEAHPRQTAAEGDAQTIDLVRSAIAEERLQVFFQPIVPLRGETGELYQTMLRIQTVDGGILAAGEFLPAIEGHELIVEIDRWVSRQALMTVRTRDQGGHRVHLFVSQSGRSLEDKKRYAWLETFIKGLKLDQFDVTFEFRLADVRAKLGSARLYLKGLQRLGFTSLLTGFDSDPTSLQILKQLPCEFVKVSSDHFIDDSEALGSLTAQVHELGRQVIVTRVEDLRCVGQLWAAGTDFIQGNFIQRPEDNLNYDFSESVLDY